MSDRNTGGPAFPVQDASTWQGHGMTLRDYFAAKALAALLVADGTVNASFTFRAKEAYEIADAMLKEREK